MTDKKPAMKNMAASQKTRPGFSFLVCPDYTLLKQEIDNLLARFPVQNGERAKYLFWGDSEPDSDFWEKMSRQGLFAENRAIIVRQANCWNAGVWKAVSSALGKVQDTVWPFFCLEVEREKGKFKIPPHILNSRCMTFAEKNGWVWKDPGLSGSTLKSFVQNQARAMGIILPPQTLEIFCARVIPNAQAVLNELEKLLLSHGKGNIAPEILEMDSTNSDTNIFACIKNLQQGKIENVLKEVCSSNDQGLLFAFIALLARELRILWQILAGESVNVYPAELSFKSGLARTMGAKGIAAAFSSLADAEWQVKSGNRSPGQALEYLCMEMMCHFTGRPVS